MKIPKFDPNDPKLTAYALGETAALSRQETEAMKQLIEQDPEAKAFSDIVVKKKILLPNPRKSLIRAARLKVVIPFFIACSRAPY